MKSKWLLGLAPCAIGVVFGFAESAKPPLIPLQDFCHGPAVMHTVISPDGNAVAYVAAFEKDASVAFLNLETRKTSVVDIPFSHSPLETGAVVNYFTWIGPKRAAYNPFQFGLAAIDYDGSNYAGLSGEARQQTLTSERHTFIAPYVLHAFNGADSGDVLLLQFDLPPDIDDGQFHHLSFPNVFRVNSRVGTYSRDTDNPGNVSGWLTDKAGVVRIGVQTEKALNRVIYRESEKDEWQVLRGLDYHDRRNIVLGLAGDGKTLYLGLVTPKGKWGVYAYDLPSQKVGELILAHDQYDIVPPDSIVAHDGFAMQGLVFSQQEHALLGIRYVTVRPRSYWMDPTLGAVQTAVDQALPKRINTITSFSDDLKRMVVLSWTGRDPGVYYIFDLEKKTLKPLFPRTPWIKPAQMAEVFPVSYKARDGLLIEGYLTLPAGREPKHLPLLVFPHGGPWVRDSMDFDEMAQFLANRGYAVLKMNYRGSSGYGDDFRKKGQRQIGHKLQDDIADATHWAIDQGIADPRRIGILGGSYGGYSTLMGLLQTPELYCCGIDIAGVTDWIPLIKYDKHVIPLGYTFIKNNIGDPDRDAAELSSISPVSLVGKLRAPLLIVHGKDDPTVPYEQATELMAALDRAHKPYELMAKQNEMHGFRGYQDVVALFGRIEQFLAVHMPSDVNPAPTVATR